MLKSNVMAKVTQINRSVNSAEKRSNALNRYVIQTFAIEGITVTESDLLGQPLRALAPLADRGTIPPVDGDRPKTS